MTSTQNLTEPQQIAVRRIVAQYRRVRTVRDTTTDPRKARNAAQMMSFLIAEATKKGVRAQVMAYVAR